MVSPMPATLTSLPDEIFDKILAELSLGEILRLSDAGHFPLHARSRIDERIASLEEAAAEEEYHAQERLWFPNLDGNMPESVGSDWSDDEF